MPVKLTGVNWRKLKKFNFHKIKWMYYVKAYLPSFEELNRYVDILKPIQVRLSENLYNPTPFNTIFNI